MKCKKNIVCISCVFFFLLSNTVYAISEADVQNAVNSSSKETVSGNLFIWFLCAIAFLKVSQKIESFISSLGVSSRKAGGSMLGEVLIAARGIGMLSKGSMGFHGFGIGGKNVSSENSYSPSYAKNNSIVTNSPSISTGRNSGFSKPGSPGSNQNTIGFGGRKLTGEEAASSFSSYFGLNESANISESAQISENGFNNESVMQNNAGDQVIPQFSNVEMGDGIIEGVETSSQFPDGIKFAMYDAAQFEKPEQSYSVMTAVDNSNWYKQYESAVTERIPHMSEDGKLVYSEKTVQKMPNPPKRRDST